MKTPRSIALLLGVLLPLIGACQKSDQSAIQPEKLAENSAAPAIVASAAPERASASARAEGAAARAAGPGSRPLVPFAKGHGPGDVRPRPASPNSPAASATAPSVAAEQPAPEVKVLAAGSEPRSELRLHVKAGASEKMRMTMTMNIAMKLGAKSPPATSLPPMIMDMVIKVLDTSANGDIHYRFDLTGTDVGASAAVAPKVSAMMKKALAQLEGLNGTAVVSSRGFNRDAHINMPKGADAQTKQVMQGMEQAMQQLGAPLPAEPVGVGARWQVVSRMTQNGITIRQGATYTLVKKHGDAMSCRVSIDQQAPHQKVVSPLGPTVDLLFLKSEGGGSMDLLLTKVAPVKSAIGLNSKVRMALPRNQTMDMRTKMDIVMSSP